MKLYPRTRLLVVAALFAVAVLGSSLAVAGCSTTGATKGEAGGQGSTKVDPETLEQQKLFAAKCGFCHDLERVAKSGHKGKEWEQVVARMVNHDNGSCLTAKDVPVLVEYLKKTYR